MVTKFTRTFIQPNPLEAHYWVDLTENPYGGVIKYYNGEDWVKLNNDDNDLHQTMPLTIKSSDGSIQVMFDGVDPKELLLTKEMVGLGNVDNTADADKNVKHSEHAGYSYELKRNTDNKSYVTYGLIGENPFTSIGNLNEETWIKGNPIYFYCSPNSNFGKARMSINYEGDVRIA